MSIVISSSVRRWLVPASAALAVIGGGVAIGAITQAADRAAPPRSAAELLTDLQNTSVNGLSGTVVTRVDLGLPPLPTGSDGADLSALVSGTHTLRVWYASPNQARVAVLGPSGETDVITNGTDVWTWSSRTNTATHRTIAPGTPAPGALPFPLPSAGGGFGLTPQALARAALAMLEPSTEVTTNGSASVAGRDAFELVLAPRDPASLIGSVRLAVDAAEHVPLRFAVLARGSNDPAIDVAFTQISFDRPDASRFAFNPPPGATVVEAPPRGTDADHPKPDATKPDATKPGLGRPQLGGSNLAMVGTGWTTVIVARMPDGAMAGAPDGIAAMLEALPKVNGDWGSGRLLSSRLFSVLLTDDGRVLIGAVGPQRLYEAAADPAARLGS
jgi:outer membrane lipoprotein-sorting protein